VKELCLFYQNKGINQHDHLKIWMCHSKHLYNIVFDFSSWLFHVCATCAEKYFSENVTCLWKPGMQTLGTARAILASFFWRNYLVIHVCAGAFVQLLLMVIIIVVFCLSCHISSKSVAISYIGIRTAWLEALKNLLWGKSKISSALVQLTKQTAMKYEGLEKNRKKIWTIFFPT